MEANEPIRIPITDTFDLHAIQPRETVAAVEAYLEEAAARGFKIVRIIHGRGMGVQRATVRRLLARSPRVTSYHDAPPESGGWGATVAILR
jgi:dsDNA-specific endonuclease/ATPase MutS2